MAQIKLNVVEDTCLGYRVYRGCVKACDLVAIFKKINPRVQVIVISSEESIGLVKRLRGAGIFYQAMKPVDLEEIRSAVECAFEKIERENLKEGFFPFLIPRRVPA